MTKPLFITKIPDFIEKDIKPLMPGELFIPYYPRINGPRKTGIFFDQMLTYARLRKHYQKQDEFIFNNLKSFGFEVNRVTRVGNQMIEHMLTRSITEKIEDDIEMMMYRIFGVEYVTWIKHPEQFIPFIDFGWGITSRYRGGYYDI